MHRINSVCYGVTLSLGAAALAGCSGSPLPKTANASPVRTTSNAFVNGASNRAARGGRLFVADNQTSQILIYPAGVQNPAPTGTISEGVSNPLQLAVDRQGTLYVQNSTNTITEYLKGQKEVSKTLTEPGEIDPFITVGSDRTVYAANGEGVFEFAGGGTKPTQLLRMRQVVGLALDSKNDLYVAQQPCDSHECEPGNVFEFTPGSRKRRNLDLELNLIGGLAIDADDNLLVGDFEATFAGVVIFKPGSKTPFRRISTEGYMPYQFALDRDEKHLYLSYGFVSQVNVYDYATGLLAWTVTHGLSSASGVALQPAAPQ